MVHLTAHNKRDFTREKIEVCDGYAEKRRLRKMARPQTSLDTNRTGASVLAVDSLHLKKPAVVDRESLRKMEVELKLWKKANHELRKTLANDELDKHRELKERKAVDGSHLPPAIPLSRTSYKRAQFLRSSPCFGYMDRDNDVLDIWDQKLMNATAKVSSDDADATLTGTYKLADGTPRVRSKSQMSSRSHSMQSARSSISDASTGFNERMQREREMRKREKYGSTMYHRNISNGLLEKWNLLPPLPEDNIGIERPFSQRAKYNPINKGAEPKARYHHRGGGGQSRPATAGVEECGHKTKVKREVLDPKEEARREPWGWQNQIRHAGKNRADWWPCMLRSYLTHIPVGPSTQQ